MEEDVDQEKIDEATKLGCEVWELGDAKAKLEEEYSNLNEDQISEFYEAFSKFDKEDEETIPNTELATLMRALGQQPTEDELEEMIEEFDPDDNGTIYFPRFLVIMARRLKDSEMEEQDKESSGEETKENQKSKSKKQ